RKDDEGTGSGPGRQYQFARRDSALGGERTLLRVKSGRHHDDESAVKSTGAGDYGQFRGSRRDRLQRRDSNGAEDDRRHSDEASGDGGGSCRSGALFPDGSGIHYRAGDGGRWRVEPAIGNAPEAGNVRTRRPRFGVGEETGLAHFFRAV